MSSIPRGVGGPPPPGMDGKRGKLMCIKVRLLDDSIAVFHLGHKALGETLLDEVSRHLNLLENDYFGLEFVDNDGCHIWLDMEKPILRQISATNDAKFHLIIKFYSPNPVDLEEEYTRYLLCLQIRRDLSQGHFVCAEGTAALLAAYLVQSDCGDFSPEDYPDPSYLSHTRFVPNQTIYFQQKVMENHKKLVGLSPEESDLQMLEVARRCDFYGIKFHPAKDIEGTEACLAVMHLGIKVFHQLHCVSTFSWAKIRKLSFKRKKLLIKLHPDTNQYYKETIEFVFETRNECKNFWKKCVEHHAFFRCSQVEFPKKDTKLFSKGSSFRYHGRTQKQLIDYVREHHKRREPFTRALRSGYQTCLPSTTSYSTVVRRERPHSTHASMPHVSTGRTESGTLDARTRQHRHDNGHDSDRGAVSDAEGGKGKRKRIQQQSPTENMSLSLPNVLSDDLQIVCQEVLSQEPAKSKSGDNFLEMNTQKEFDNISQDSYRLSDHEKSKADQLSTVPSNDNNQVYSTVFTSKRVGDVVVKRVLSNSKSNPNTDDECSSHADSAHTFPSKRTIKEFPFNSHNMVPIEIDGPNTVQPQISESSSLNNKTGPIYTSSGALLLKPKVIFAEGVNSTTTTTTPTARVSYKAVSPDSGTYSTVISPQSEKNGEKRSTSPQTYGAIGPLPGKVITKENLMITPEGIKEKKQKPVVPPKPKGVILPQSEYSEVRYSEVRREESTKAGHPVVNLYADLLQKNSPNDGENMEPSTEGKKAPLAEVESPPPPPPPHQEKRILTRPALISVQSEDNPDIQKCHLFNSEIPYTLTMRTVDSPDPSTPLSTFKSKQNSFEMSSNSLGRSSTKSPESFARRKSLDLVPRKRLPSPGNFSSTDHTINPTAPDTTDVLDYLLRRRSMSHERSALSKKGKRGDPRRQTQPVRFDLPPSPEPGTGGSTPMLALGRAPQHSDEDLEKEKEEDDLPMPPPPPSIQQKQMTEEGVMVKIKTPPPPPPKPKGAAERVSLIKVSTSVTTTSTVAPPTNTCGTIVEEAHSTAVLSVSSEHLKSEREEKQSDSPPFIDDSPKSTSEDKETTVPTRVTERGVLWTDF